MSKALSLFNNYNQSENRITSYCGLMLKLVYEESPRLFNDLLTGLLPQDTNTLVGPQFRQQYKSGYSTPDLVITQQSFVIAIEAKRNDWHYSDQVKRHLEGLKTESGTKILLLLSNAETDTIARIDPANTLSVNTGVRLAALTYEELLDALTEVCKTDPLVNLLNEFRAYLDEASLLPGWKYLLDIVNCSRTLDELDADVFFCPDTGGSYHHRRARWFGAYVNKEVGVRSIHKIDAIVSVGIGGVLNGTTIKWNNKPGTYESQLKTKAIELVNRFRPHQMNEVALQVFLLGNKAVTSLKKESSGGVRTRCYVYDERFNTESVERMGQLLQDDLKSWGRAATVETNTM